MSTFDMVVVGCGGGPSETNLSAYGLFRVPSGYGYTNAHTVIKGTLLSPATVNGRMALLELKPVRDSCCLFSIYCFLNLGCPLGSGIGALRKIMRDDKTLLESSSGTPYTATDIYSFLR
jgi:hypothetical protein